MSSFAACPRAARRPAELEVLKQRSAGVGLTIDARFYANQNLEGTIETVEESDLYLEAGAEGDDPVFDWRQVFGNEDPVEVEIGIGKGRFIIDAAQRRPQVNFVGIEWAAKYLRLAHGRAHKRGLDNIRLLRCDAREFIECCVASQSLQAVHLYFPDPWPKKRHHKRRLFNRPFAVEVERVLIPGGALWLATDHEDYYRVMEEVLGHSHGLQEVEGVEWTGARTNYEEKYIGQGKTIFRKVLKKNK